MSGKWGWDARRPPTLAEQASAAAETPKTSPHRARKDRRRWCRGKVGVEHQVEVRLSRWGRYWVDRGTRPACRWNSWWKWVDGRAVRDEDTWGWECSHIRGCSACGKVLEPLLPKTACPDYREREGS